jgi:hypothetical protein
VARTKERRLRRQKCREQYSEEYQLREQQGVSPPGTPAESSSEEEEESDGGRAPPERWNPPPPSPQAVEAVVELVPVAGAEAPATGLSVEEPASAAEAPASATVAPAGAIAAPPEPSRKRKWGFSNLR